MAEAILLSSIKSIGKLLIDEGNFLQGVNDQVKLLHEDLQRMQWFLKYAESKQNGSTDNFQLWVSEFRAIAYEADDLIEDYALRVSSRKKESFTNALKRYSCIISEGYARYSLGLKIRSLRTRISNLTKNFDEYGVRAIMEEGSRSSIMQQQLRRTYSFVAEEDIIGIYSDVDMLVKYLLNGSGSGHHKVVSIYGMGGLGKTTVAKRVYHHPCLKQYFTGFAWVCVSQQWQTKDLLQGILVKLNPDQRSLIMQSREDELVRLLHQLLQDRRCLVVLDDIWSLDAWDCIKDAMSISDQGSKVLLTTRNRDVAVSIGPNGYHHQPPFLNEEESWELLQNKSLTGKTGEDWKDLHELEELGKKMLKHCGGLPLAVVVLGGILKTEKGLREWNIVHDNIKSYLEKGEKIGEQIGEVPKILAFSYYDLPYQLKSCFVYLGIFPEDHEIRPTTLYHLWMAQGMIFENDKIGQESTMDVAERYLEELANRCMVQVQLPKKPALIKFESCRLHDVMRDLCLLKAKEEYLYKLIDSQQRNDDASLVDSQQRHYGLVLRLVQEDLSKYIPLQKEQTNHLRSFMYMLSWNGHLTKKVISQVNNFKMLRVLDIELSSCNGYHRKSPVLKCIGKLIHLRYLRLRCCAIFKLPSSLGNLEYLETLYLAGTKVYRMLDVLWKMKNLKYLYLPYTSSKLRLDGLTKLEILESFDSRICDPKDLAKLTNLRGLSAVVYAKLETLQTLVNNISNFNNPWIIRLEIRNCDFLNNSEKGLPVLEQVLFYKNLRTLDIIGALCKHLPRYQPHHIFPGLCDLYLYKSAIEEDPMETLEKLPNLRSLFLDGDSFMGKEMICHSRGFPQLESLTLSGLHNLEKWKVDEGAMPKLLFLSIEMCEKLEMIPDGLRTLTSLKQLNLASMPEEFRNRVRIVNDEEGPDFDKIRHVPLVCLDSKVMSETVAELPVNAVTKKDPSAVDWLCLSS